MKKYASLLLFALLLNGCDDGDLTVDTIDFSNESITSQTCDPLTNSLIYRLKPQESLLLQLLPNSIKNDPSVYSYDIDNTSSRVVYRAYDGTVATANICGTIPPKTPNITEEWYGKGGKIEITTSANVETNTTDGSTKITGYNHNIVFRNITFAKPAGDQVEAEYVFGTFKTSYTTPSTTFTNPVQQCKDSKQIYNFNTSSALTIDNIDPALIANEITTTPRTGLINANGTTNKVLLRTYINGTLTEGYFCNTTIPSTPAVSETWIAQDGIAGTSGIIEVTTTKVGTNIFTHTIVLKSVILQKDHSTFKLPTNYTLGNLEVVAP